MTASVTQAGVEHGARCPVCLAPDTAEVRAYRTGPVTCTGPFAHLSIHACEECHAAFAWPLPQEEALEAFYAEQYRAGRAHDRLPPSDGWDGGAVRARAQVDFVIQHCRSPQSWLDIGAGHGQLLNEARRRHVSRTAGIEPDTECARRIPSAGHDLYAGLSTVTRSWDVVSCSHVVEHLTDPRRFLRAIRGLLSDRGHVFCEVPNETNLSGSSQDLPHLLFFTRPAVERLFRDSGLKIVSIVSCGRKAGEPAWRNRVRQCLRRLVQQVFRRPPRWIDHVVHPHFQYHHDQSAGAWIRVLARKA